MLEITATRAYDNSFFALAQANASQAILEHVVQEWYPVTQAFCLGLMSYNALFSSWVLGATGRHRDRFEAAILVPLAIGAEEFGTGQLGPEAIHFRMFARLGEPLGIHLDALRSHPFGALPETRRLVEAIQHCFTDLYLGAGCIRVVEATAYSIVEAMDALFRPRLSADGTPLFSEENLEYISLHLEIEKQHDSMASDFLELLCGDDSAKRSVDAGLVLMCDRLGAFWEALATVSFPMLQCTPTATECSLSSSLTDC